jgi:hypothetical protein
VSALHNPQHVQGAISTVSSIPYQIVGGGEAPSLRTLAKRLLELPETFVALQRSFLYKATAWALLVREVLAAKAAVLLALHPNISKSEVGSTHVSSPSELIWTASYMSKVTQIKSF